MCGIVGVMNLSCERRIEYSLIEEMANRIVHRGPDDFGIYVDEKIGLGFRRLSIVDLVGGYQPIFNENRNIAVVCNGEIFNHQYLRERLKEKGHKFVSSSDCEILVHLYEEHGKDFINYLDGQFALALYDKGRNELVLARDHFGIAPLFYTITNNQIIFASEIKSILQCPGIHRKVDLTGLDQVFSLPGIVSPRTMFEDVQSLQPGHLAYIKDGEIEIKEYWDIQYPRDGELTYNNDESFYLEKLDDLLKKSVKKRMMSDVPIGAYLSGGLDSSLIASLMKVIDPSPKKLFSMTFADSFFTEEAYQDIMADYLKYECCKTKFNAVDVSNYLRRVIEHCECPLKESYNTASISLSKAAFNGNIKVILTGEGADELFAGYPSYRFDVFRRHKARQEMVSDEEKAIRKLLWGSDEFFYEKNFSDFKAVKQALFSSKVNDRYDSFDFTKLGLINTEKINGVHTLHKRSYLDLKLRIADHLISDHGDRMLFANSVEGRFPFLDVELVNFVACMPPELKLNGYQEKYLLKKLGERYLPNEITNREKFGFAAPGSPQLLQSNIEWINDLLSYETIKKQGYFDPGRVEKLKKQYSTPGFMINIPYEEDLLMPIITFGIFKEVFNIPDL